MTLKHNTVYVSRMLLLKQKVITNATYKRDGYYYIQRSFLVETVLAFAIENLGNFDISYSKSQFLEVLDKSHISFLQSRHTKKPSIFCSFVVTCSARVVHKIKWSQRLGSYPENNYISLSNKNMFMGATESGTKSKLHQNCHSWEPFRPGFSCTHKYFLLESQIELFFGWGPDFATT